MKTAQETSRVDTTKSTSPAALPDMEGWGQVCLRSAEEAGIESVLLSFSRYLSPTTISIACAIGRATGKLKIHCCLSHGPDAADHLRPANHIRSPV